MARFKKHLLVAIGSALAGMIGAAFCNGSAQAVVATLVEIVNTSANPVQTQHVAADNPATQPVAMYGYCGAPATSVNCTETNPYIVPTGKRLVIESINGTITLPHGQVPLAVSLGVTTAGVPLTLYIAGLNFHKNVSGVDNYYFESTSRVYVDPGTSATFNFDRSPDSVGSATFSYAVSGHLENIQ